LRINGANIASTGSPMYGVYVRLEAFNDEFAQKHFPDDPNGNLYTCFRDAGEAQLLYQGANPNTYRNSYIKANHEAQDDFSDLIHMLDVLNNAPDATYFQDVSKVINVPQWLHYIALDSLLVNYETGLNMGIGDDYFLYCSVADPRFVLIPHDLDTILDQGNAHGSINQSIFSIVNGVASYNGVDGLKRFFSHPDVIPLYYQAFLDNINEFFNPETLDPLFDQVLGGFTPQDSINAMKQFVRQRSAAVLTQIPHKLTITNSLPVVGGYPHAASTTLSVSGTANAAKTRSVLVNGRLASWTPLDGKWSISGIALNPGINRVVIQAFDAAGKEVDRSSIDVWYDTPSMTTKAGGSLNADEVWTAAAGPYRVTGSITIPAGRTLTIEPGATVFLDNNIGFTVYGRLVAQGTEYRRIRFTRVPGTTAQWAGVQIPDSRQDNIIAYADLEFGGSRSSWITTGNNNASEVGPTARLTIDHATFSGSDTQYFNIWDSQIIIRNSVFADLGGHYLCKAERMPANGWFIIEGNIFGHCHGDTDVFHLNSVSVKGGPVARIINNVFTGGGDDLVDDNESDTHIEGNLFMHANVGNSGRSASAAVTTGPGGGSASTDNLESQHLTVVRNIFYHNDYGILSKTGAYSQIYNNVFIQNAGAILFDEPTRSDSGPGRASYVENCIFWGNGPEVDGSPSDNGTGTFVNRRNTQLTVNNSMVKSEFLDLGTGNIDADPLFVDADRELYVEVNLPCFSTGFPGFAEGGYLLEGMVPDVHLIPDSSARGAGFNGVDMGYYVPTTASIGGVPISPTWRTDATLFVGGTDVYGYKYRIAGPGMSSAWSGELARMMPVTALTHSGLTAFATVASHGFSIGDIVEIIGADRAAYNGWFTVLAVTSNTFSYTLTAAADLIHPDHLDVWVRRPQAIRLAGLTNGVYTVSVIKKNSMGVWQDEGQPTIASLTVDTSSRRMVINEVLANNQSVLEHEGTFPDLVELYYDGPSSIDLSGMTMTDDPNDPGRFVFPAGTTMAPGQYLVLFADADPGTSGLHLGFALKSEGDGVYLEKNGMLLDSIQFGLQLPDLSIGRVGSAGEWHLAAPTFGQANVAHPLGNPGTLKINEWLANGQVLFADDFIEIYNPHADPVDMGGMFLTNNPVAQPGKHMVGPLTFVAGNGYAVFWADNSTAPGHVGFRLSSDGEMIGLFYRQVKEIDKVLYGPQTTDVSEGRAPDGADLFAFLPLPTPGVANPSVRTTTTTMTLVDERATKRVLVPAGPISEDWKGARQFDDSKWALCAGGPGGVGYDTASDYQSLITLDLKSQMSGSGKNTTCYIRIQFVVDPNILADVKGLTLKVRYDDGFVAYINGKEVARGNYIGAPSWNSKADVSREANVQGFDGTIDLSRYIGELKTGLNILAIQGMNNSSTSSDLLISAAIDVVFVKEEGGQSAFENDLNLLDGLRVTELMYSAAGGSNLDFIELQNVGNKILDLTGVRFTQGIDFVFPAMMLAPGQFVVVAGNLAAFRSQYGATVNVAGEYWGKLSNSGEGIVLSLPLPLEAAIMRFSYEDTWYPTANGGGDSLVINDPLAPPATWNQLQSWRAAAPSPGRP